MCAAAAGDRLNDASDAVADADVDKPGCGTSQKPFDRLLLNRPGRDGFHVSVSVV